MNVIQICRDIARMSEEPGRTTRTFLSRPMHDVHLLLGNLMRSAGMDVHIDAAGNLRGVHGNPAAPRLIIGSHLDTVPNAGAFDGVLGVVLGIALVETRPRIAIEVIGFSEEEGVRFVKPFLGSRALVGDTGWLTPEIENAIRAFGLNPADLPAVRFVKETIGYLEFHIEQGPVLESLDLPLGVVDAIAGQSRFVLYFEGKANHAGTTPMSLRHDALVAAARWICKVEQYAKEHDGLVATVGSLQVSPNAVNVIPGEVRASLDVRHANDTRRRRAAAELVVTKHDQLLDRNAVKMDETLTDELACCVDRPHRMVSGAGHDAMIVAPHIPSAMLFLRSPGGISHHPDETVLPADVDAALAAGTAFLKRLEDKYV